MYQISEYHSDRIEAVLNILAKYDIMGIGDYCSKDEYEIEAIEIANRSEITTLEELSLYIKEVFKFWFNEDVNKLLCDEIADDIREQLTLNKSKKKEI